VVCRSYFRKGVTEECGLKFVENQEKFDIALAETWKVENSFKGWWEW
jgi:hypothetical protein